MRGTSKASPSRSKSKTLKRLRTRFGVPAALIAVLALALPAGASAVEPGQFEQFTGASKPLNIVSCGENLWFTEQVTPKIGRVTPSGVVTEYETLSAPGFGITCGPDGNVWVALQSASKIAKVIPSEPETPATEFAVGTLQPNYITAGPDGNLWFIAGIQDRIGKMTTTGTLSEYEVPAESSLCSISPGSDGNVWFGDCGSPKQVGKITPAGVITPYELPAEISSTLPNTLALGSDGNIWFNGSGGGKGIANVTPAGSFNLFSSPETFWAPGSFVTGPDGNVWAANVSTANESQEVTVKADESLGGSYVLCGVSPLTEEEKCTKELLFSSSTTVVREALRTEVYGGTNVASVANGAGGATGNLWTRKVTFGGELSRWDMPAMTCKAENLTGTNPSCGVAETVKGRPSKLARIKPNGSVKQFTAPLGAQITFAVNGGALAAGPDGKNIWFTQSANGKIGVFGVANTPQFKLTVTKEGTGGGTVVSNPAGIECGANCFEHYIEGEKVTLTASADTDSVFTSWVGCLKTEVGTGALGRTCTVKVTKAMTVKAKFTAVKAITASRDSESTGYGTISSAPGGIACGPACTSATAVFTEGQTVLLKAAPVAATSEFNPATGWTGCDSVITEGINAGKCEVVASSAKAVEAKFTAIPQNTLAFEKKGKGVGTVSSAPAGISCGPTCTTGEATFLKTKTVLLKAVPSVGSSFTSETGWTGCDSVTGEGKCSVTMTAAKSVTAEFK